MLLQLVFGYLLDRICFPRLFGTCVWLIIGIIWFSYSSYQLGSPARTEPLLTETICKIDARHDNVTLQDNDSACYTSDKNHSPCPPASCTTYDVSYTIGEQTYSTSAYVQPPRSNCFWFPPFEVHSQYYCWYLTDNPAVVYLNKIDVRGYRLSLFISLFIMALSGGRFLYLIMRRGTKIKTREIQLDYMPPQSNEVELTVFSAALVVAQSILGLLIFYILILLFMDFFVILNGFKTVYEHTFDVPVSCTVIEAQSFNSKTELKVSYPYRDLTYITWIKANKKVSDYPVNAKIPCSYSSEAPRSVTINSEANDAWTPIMNDLVSSMIHGFCLILLIIFSKVLRIYSRKN